ncbi:MAG: thiamine pyrophosphate-binding protein [Candidatus Methylomirabilota bacterium]
MARPIRGARFLAESLHGYGVTHLFYVEAMLRHTLLALEQLGVRRILTHSEKAAAYMADGYARAGRKVGVCMAQSVGAANLASGLQEPRLGRAPVLALTGRAALLAEGRHAYQEVPHSPLFGAVCKSTAPVTTLAQLPVLLRQAFRDATSGCPGPVHLDLLGVSGQEIETAEADLTPLVETSYAGVPAHRPAPDSALVREAAALLGRAKRPVIVAGGGVAASGARREVAALAERLAIPVATSLNGKASLPEIHPLNLGVMGRYSRRCANQVVSEADLVLFVGSGTGELVTNAWTVPRAGTPVVQIDIDPAELGRSYPAEIGLAGDARVTLQMLLAETTPRSAGAWTAHAQEMVRQWRDEVAPSRASDALPIRPERLCREIEAWLPSDAILVADTGYAAIWASTMIGLTHPAQRFLRSAGSLGWAFPAALGAKCGCPDRPVICFTGDGGFWYHLSELETARRCGIPIIAVVNNNAALGQCVGSIRGLYAGLPGKPEEMYAFSPISFARIAEEMGCLGIRVETPDRIAPALRAALSSGRPAVVDVVTDLGCRPSGPWTPQPPHEALQSFPKRRET